MNDPMIRCRGISKSYHKGRTVVTPLENGRALRVTVSIGLAHARPDFDATLDQLLRLADKAMYAAKEGGRNQVRQMRVDAAALADPPPAGSQFGAL